ncbi:toll/interleukin-1 receptor domain-containing protein [Helicobacter pylori]|uniref:toll/interleukin-1 receptor domain-containing protein n=1 Tax=Helicobacter pylori TaxID=210 RepID=UPI001495D1DA|nr:toll/interleukin-1 receptor domain-containing protein [Helicobacter pylori]NPS34814.1 toll/interleukin-1 receptor domain-containing protein [Helicobacter pylori]
MKAFKVDLDSRENQIILKPNTRHFNNQAHQVDEAAKKIHELIKEAKCSNDDIILNHNEIKEAFFSPFKPQLKNAQVFLSHSHADRNKALKVKNYLESETNQRVFIDSLFWDYKDDVLNELAEYDDTSKIEDAFTLILRESLQDMIEKCPYFVFLQSNNSVSFNQDLSRITYSAWIYEELKIANGLIADSARQESHIKAMRVSHNITNLLRRFKLISLDSLSNLL